MVLFPFNVATIMQPHPFVSESEYFELDARAPEGVRLEYFGGIVYCNGQPYIPDLAEAMAGETEAHSRVKDNAFLTLQEQMPEGCRAYTAGMRVLAPGYSKQDYAYSDVIVTCGTLHFDESKTPPVLLNPVLLVEILSRSTRSHDYITKEKAYFRVESLLEYWIVDPERFHVRRHHHGVVEEGAIVRIDFENETDVVPGDIPGSIEVPLAAFYVK